MDNGGYLDTTSSKGLIPAFVNPPFRSGRLENCQRILAFMSYANRTHAEHDWNEVCSIYEEGIATGNATFETEAPSWERWDTGHLPGCRLVARGQRCHLRMGGYQPRFQSARLRRCGRSQCLCGRGQSGARSRAFLLAALIAAAEQDGIWMLQAGVFPENKASLILHERCGFRQVGRRERLGQSHGTWRDVILLERRSTVVGLIERTGN